MLTNLLLYLSTTLIWGSTWFAIKLQLGVVPPIWSVAYRFLLASGLLVAFCLCSKKSLTRFNAIQHRALLIQGIFMFSLNYVLYYLGSHYFISALVSLVFATIQIMNIINGRIFLGTLILPRVAIGGLIGLTGLGVVFSTQLASVSQTMSTAQIWMGLGICALATYFASLGNIASVYCQRLKIPIVEGNAISMFYGALIVIVLGLGSGETPILDLSKQYIGSLLYLVVFGTLLAFAAYFVLLARLGAQRAAYTFVVLPLVSLTLSSEFEHFTWSLHAIIGVLLILVGNILVIAKKTPAPAAEAG